MKNWLYEMAEQAQNNRNGRDIVIWGYYKAANDLEEVLLNKYGIKTVFYVDGNKKLVDEVYIFSPDILEDKSSQYYVLIPLSYYQSIKESLEIWGYDSNDYYYFNDCVIVHDEKEYLDKHGNKIINPPKNVKFTFMGYDNEIIFNRPAGHFSELTFTFGSENHIVIGCANISSSDLFFGDGNRGDIGEQCVIKRSKIDLFGESEFEFKNKAVIQNSHMVISEKSKVDIGLGSVYEGNAKLIKACVHIGDDSEVACELTIYNDSAISIGNGCLITGRSDKYLAFNQKNIVLVMGETDVVIEDECLMSINIKLLAGDGHAIFDMATGENINKNKNNNIIIKKHTWIGANAILLAGTKISEDSIIGAGSVVKGSFPQNCIIAGNPAKVVKKDRTWDFDWNLEHI